MGPCCRKPTWGDQPAMKPRSIRSVLLAGAACAAGLVRRHHHRRSLPEPRRSSQVAWAAACRRQPDGEPPPPRRPTAIAAGGTFSSVVLGGQRQRQPARRDKEHGDHVPGAGRVEHIGRPAPPTLWSGRKRPPSGAVRPPPSADRTVSIKVPGPCRERQVLHTAHPVKFQLKATQRRAAGPQDHVPPGTPAYTLTAAGSFNVSCNANTPLTTLTQHHDPGCDGPISTSLRHPPSTSTTERHQHLDHHPPLPRW